jgi:hypothetical protein
MEGLPTFDERKERKSDVENSEDERRRLSIGSLKKKALNASNKLTHSLKKRGKRKVEHRPSSFTIEDVRDEAEERAVFTFQQELLNRNLLPDRHNDYHLLLRLVPDENCHNFLYSMSSSVYDFDCCFHIFVEFMQVFEG